MLKDIKYVNYHKHSIYSNTSTIDSVTFPHHYMTRAKELGQTIYSTCEHGTEGNYLEAYDLCKANNLKMIYAIEAYYVDDRLEKDRSNTHIVLIAKNKEGFKDINRIISEANKTGFYYKPRIDLALLLSVNPQNIIITTACVAGRVNRGENPIELFVKPLFQHFDKNMYLEVQSHVHPLQSNHNKTMLELSNQYGIEIIHGCDSHYIHPEDNELRDILLKGKEIYYQDEEGFILDYPTSVTIFERYKEQGILSEQEVFKALNNTLIFNECEDLKFNKDIKMPSLYPHEDVNKKLRDMLQSKLKDELLQINPSRHQEYRDAIEYEMDIIEKSVIPNEDGSKSYMADYFLLNQKIIEKATKEYGGVLSKTGRGCFTADSLIHTKNNIKTLDKVVVGDEVISSDGLFHRVTDTMIYDVNEDLIKITHRYGTDKHYPSICTLDHKILINRDNKIDFIKAQDIQKTDYVCVPKIKNIDSKKEYYDLVDYNVFNYEYDDEYIYEVNKTKGLPYLYSPTSLAKELGLGTSILDRFANGDEGAFKKLPSKRAELMTLIPFKTQEEYCFYVKTHYTKKIKRFIPNNKEFNIFIGLMYGDGCVQKRRISLALNSINQKNSYNRGVFNNIANQLGFCISENKSKNRNLTQLIINSNIFSYFMSSEFFLSKKGKDKVFNENLFNQNQENLDGLLLGFDKSDGSDKEDYRTSFDNTSLSIINAYKLLCLMTNKGVNSLGVRKAHTDSRGYNSKESYKLRISSKIPNQDENYYYLPITKTEILPNQKTKVYDITVEGQHNYLLNNMIVHNSAVSFLTNKLLGFTEIDRLEAPVPLYPTRFMSTTRIVTNRSLPDIDFNLNAPEPFIKASRDLLGEDNTYWMIAYGTLQDVSAFRLVCKAKGLNISEYNDVAKELDKYRTDPKWEEYIELSTKFIGVIDSISPSPCSVLMLNEPISEQIGLMKVGDLICCNIDGYTSDVWKYLKNDFLTVTVWKIIADTYKLLGEEIPNIRQLGELLDDEVWGLYKNGHTSTLNQVDSDNATPKVMKYAPKTVAELTAFVAGIRPSFSSLLYNFLDRQPYTTGVPQVDKLLAPSFNYILYQESIMNFLVWCGLPEESTYDVIKKISKKKFTDEQLAELKEKIMKGFITNTGSLDGFDDIWKVIEDAVHYAFNSSHALAVAWDSLYGAYLKAKHPLEYFTVTSNIYNGNLVKTNKLNAEFEAFDITTSPIKFRYSKGEYFYSTDLRTIYKGVGSIKSINCNVGEQLYSIGGKDYSTFTDLLVTISNDTKCNKTQITNLILLDYFSEFGNSKQLFLIYQKFQERYKKTHIDKTKLKRIEEVLKYEEEVLSDESIYYTADNKMKSELEYLGYVETTIPNIPSDYYMVSDIITKFKNPQILLYRINNGESILYKIKAKIFDEAPFKKGDILHLTSIKQEKKWKMIDGKFVRVDEYDNFINTWNILK